MSKYMSKRYDPFEIWKFVLLIFLILSTFILATAFQRAGEEAEKLKKEYQEELNVCKQSGYTVFLDGEEVDANKIDLSLYTTSINHEEKVIYATKKESDNGDSVIPILWPLFFR